MHSLWSDTVNLPTFEQLKSDIHTDVLIIGGGITKNTTAKITSQHGLIYHTTKRCPHMGCALKWNPQEHSWDCPCHGSRFTEAGILIDNPATGDLNTRADSHH